MLRMGLVSTAGEPARGVLEVGLTGALGEECQVRLWPSYAALVEALSEGEEELAWLPPVAYLRARRRRPVHLLATIERDGHGSYGCALLARTSAVPSIEHLEGKRAAWIDPWSAAGYLVPRALLRAAGHDPDNLFASQTLVGSYSALLTLLREGQVEVGGCYCRLDPDGRPCAGPWHGQPNLTVLASGGPIPGDTLCTAPNLAPERLAQLRAALTSHLPPPALLVVLQATALRPPVQGDYLSFEHRYLASELRTG